MATVTMTGSRKGKLDVLRSMMRDSGYTNFVELTDGVVSVFKLGKCEFCGGGTKESGPMMLIGVPVGLLVVVGLKQMGHVPPEVDMFGDGEFCCEMCRVNADMDAEGGR